MTLTAKQERFVEEYLVDLNATQAAIRAGYSKNTAAEIGCQNLTKLNIAEAIQAAKAKRSERTEVTQDYVLKSIVETMERSKQAEAVTDRSGKPVMVELESGETAPVYTFNAAAVLKGSELLGKHLAMFTEKVDNTSSDGTMTPQSPVAIYRLPDNGRD